MVYEAKVSMSCIDYSSNHSTRVFENSLFSLIPYDIIMGPLVDLASVKKTIRIFFPSKVGE